MASETFGSRVRLVRRALGLTQAQLAARIGVAEATVRSWETDRAHPQPRWLRRLAKALGVSVEDLTAPSR
jgi:transcriptional regulator with XRE-family HTH domain